MGSHLSLSFKSTPQTVKILVVCKDFAFCLRKLIEHVAESF